MSVDALAESLTAVYLAAALIAAALPAVRCRALAAAGLVPLGLAAASDRVIGGTATGVSADVIEVLAGVGVVLVVLAIVRQVLPRRDQPVERADSLPSAGRPWALPDPFLLAGLTVALIGPDLLVVGLGTAVSLAGAARTAIGVRRHAWAGVIVLAALLLGLAWWLMGTILGPERSPITSLGEGPWSPASERWIVPLLAGPALLLAGLWPLHRSPWRLGLSLLGGVLLLRILHSAFPEGLEILQPLSIPVALVMLAAASVRLRWAELAVAGGLLALFSGPGPARWPGALLLAGGWLADAGPSLLTRVTTGARRLLARIAWLAAAVLALPAMEGALRAEVVYTILALGVLCFTALRLALATGGSRPESAALYSRPQ